VLAALLLTIGGLVSIAVFGVIGALAAGLPDPAQLETITFDQPTVVYDRSGKVELARFQREARRVITWEEVPHLVADATTTAEDRTFWENGGFDPGAIASAIGESLRGSGERGASTVTQQLVRARLLPEEYTAPGADKYLRKVLELIQSARLTDAFPGEQGKQRIMTAYLNEIYYGHDAYGIAAAASIYFGVNDLAKLTPAQAALLAGLAKSPSSSDPYRYAVADANGRLVVPKDAPPVVRRDWILQNMASSRWTHLTADQLQQALAEPVVLVGDLPVQMRAPHFDWQVRTQLEQILGGADKVETGGYKVVTSLDWTMQQSAEKWVRAALIAPNLDKKSYAAMLDELKIPKNERRWIANLRGKDLHNGALVAIDYRTGDVLAYVGSADYFRDDLSSPKFSPKYDVAGIGARQPGSAFKPVLYATAFETHALTPGSLLLDITTQFDAKAKWAPRDADYGDRGPVLVRDALQYSLNVPAIRALERTGSGPVADVADRLGLQFAGGRKAFLQAGLAGAIGTVEVRPLDLVSAYGGIASGGVAIPHRMVLQVFGPDGKLVYDAGTPKGTQAISPQAAYLVTDILYHNTDPQQNPIWSKVLRLTNTPDKSWRQAAVKTGTANDARDLATYGFLAPPDDPTAPALAVGIWMGNSDHSNPKAAKPATSLTGAAPLWHAFVSEVSKDWPVATFKAPDGVVSATIDRFSGGKPGPWTQATRSELFISGTEPGAQGAVDAPGLLYTSACGVWAIDPVKAELGPDRWKDDVRDWMARAKRGVGIKGKYDSETRYFWGERSWGGPIAGSCQPTSAQGKPKDPKRPPSPQATPPPTPTPAVTDNPKPTKPGATTAPTPTPAPTASPTAAASGGTIAPAGAPLAGLLLLFPLLRRRPRPDRRL
jgi:membrane peptidoglycan carboxypeptidase